MLRVRDDHAGHSAQTMLGAMELRLLVRLLHQDEQGIERYLPAVERGLDGLVEACASHGLSVVLLRALERTGRCQQIAHQRLAILEQRLRRQEERQRRLGDALIPIAEHFQANGQTFLLLKGPSLAARYYGHPMAREFVDLDLMIPRHDRQRVCQLLVDIGFRRRSKTLLGERLTSLFVHGFDFASDSARVDLHWGLSCHPSLQLSQEQLWSRRESFVLGGRTYDVLGKQDDVVFATLSLLRDIERGRPKAKNVLDLIQILVVTDAVLDWDALLSAGNGTRGPLVNVVSECLDLADAHDLVPKLTGVLAKHADRRIGTIATESAFQYRPRHYTLGNKLWSARVYDSGVPMWLAWWALSLPFRIAVHRGSRKQGAQAGERR